MDLMEIALKNGIKGTPDGPFLYPYSIRGRKPFSLLTDDDESLSSSSSSNEEEGEGMGTIKSIYDDELYNENDIKDDKKVINYDKKRIQEVANKYTSRRKGKELEYITREDAFEMQYAKDFEFFFDVPYQPYIRLSSYRFGKNVKYPRDLKQAEAVYKKYPRYLLNDPWPEIDISKPIPYFKQKQPPILVNKRGVPIVWLKIIEERKRHNIRRGNNLYYSENKNNKEPPRTLSDAVVAWEVSSSLLNGDLPSIIGEDKKSRKQKRFSFVRDNIRGVAEEIESWTKCPVIQTDINKYLESSWKNIDKFIDTKNAKVNDNTGDINKLKSLKSTELKNYKSLTSKDYSSSLTKSESNNSVENNVSESITAKKDLVSKLSTISPQNESSKDSQEISKIPSKVSPNTTNQNIPSKLPNIPLKKGVSIDLPSIKKNAIPKKN